ncbi:MAG: ATP-binding protein [Acidimicrobiia bacterium]
MTGAVDEGFGSWVREWRHTNRWTQERLAEALGYDVSYVAKIERGKRNPTSQFVARLADVTAIPRDRLLRLSRQPSSRVRAPLPPTPWVGRGREVAEVAALLKTEARCVTLVGSPGVGKTSLALEVAWTVKDAFRSGVSFVPLAELSTADAVAAAVVDRLGLVEQVGTPLDDVVVDALASRQHLLLLDNFEHVLAARELVARLTSHPSEFRVLVTSREGLGIEHEAMYEVPTLEFPDPGEISLSTVGGYPAIQLFVAKSQKARADFALTESNLSAVAAVCAQLDGLPLAIELTAGATRLFSPQDIVRTLRARLELPSTPGNPLAHPCLTSALDWSWDLLSGSERSLFSALGVFSGGFTLETAEAVCGGTGDDLLADLSALEAKSLVRAVASATDDSRFSILEVVRRYAVSKLDGERGQALRRRHCEFFVAVAERAEPETTAGPRQDLFLRRLDDDFSNLRTSFDWAVEHEPEHALRLAAALWRFFLRRRISEGRRWLETALKAAGGALEARTRALNGVAVLARSQGDLDSAARFLAEAGSLAAANGFSSQLALAVLNQGILAEELGHYEPAEGRFREAMDLYAGLGDERGVAYALNCLGVIALRHRRFDDASTLLLDALRRFRTVHDRWSIAMVANNLGWIAEMHGHSDEAREWYEETRRIWETLGDEHNLARALADLGRVARRSRDLGNARTLLEEALRVFHRVGNRRLAAACLVEVAEVAAQRRRNDLAARLLGAADGIRTTLGTPAWPDELDIIDEVTRRLQRTLGETAFRRAWNIGRALSLEGAIELIGWDSVPRSRTRRSG